MGLVVWIVTLIVLCFPISHMQKELADAKDMKVYRDALPPMFMSTKTERA
jgi:hypothetical protein